MSSFDPNGESGQTTVLIEMRPLEPGELAALVTTPTVDGSDPLRGPSTFTAINDFRDGTRTDFRGPEPVTSPLSIGASRQPQPAWLTQAGWIFVAVILSVLVWMRLKKATASSRG